MWRPAFALGGIETDLRNNNVIPDPFFGDNEQRLQWIGNLDWEYVRAINVTSTMLRHAHLELIFEGLDTFADVSLNGSAVLSRNNQFRNWRINAKPHLHVGQNELRIVFHSPTQLMTPIVARLPYIQAQATRSLTGVRVFIPLAITCEKLRTAMDGPGAKVRHRRHLEASPSGNVGHSTRAVLSCAAKHSVDAERAKLEFVVTVSSDVVGPATLQLLISALDGRALPTITLPEQLDSGKNVFRGPLRIDKPARWFPNGYGPQNLYQCTATLLRGSRAIAASTLRTGLRSVKLRRDPNAWDRTFYFVVNGIPIFTKGANVVPLDSFPPQITDERRRAILTAAHDAYINMLRVWGGGYYPSDSFCDLCDQLGLMVWHVSIAKNRDLMNSHLQQIVCDSFNLIQHGTLDHSCSAGRFRYARKICAKTHVQQC